MAEWEHDDWLGQFNAMVNEAMNVDPDTELEDIDSMAMSDIAAKLQKGTIDLPEAIRRTFEWVAGRHGITWHRDNESFELEAQVQGHVEITDEMKVNLLLAGEVGIADAMIKVYADPRLVVMGSGDVADIENPPSIGMCTKGWFNVAHMSPTEIKNFHWAVESALKVKLSEG